MSWLSTPTTYLKSKNTFCRYRIRLVQLGMCYWPTNPEEWSSRVWDTGSSLWRLTQTKKRYSSLLRKSMDKKKLPKCRPNTRKWMLLLRKSMWRLNPSSMSKVKLPAQTWAKRQRKWRCDFSFVKTIFHSKIWAKVKFSSTFKDYIINIFF